MKILTAGNNSCFITQNSYIKIRKEINRSNDFSIEN